MLEFDRIYNSDCIEGMKQIESGKVDLIVTDPPYCISYKTGWRADDHRFSKEILNDDNEQLIIDYMSECYRILKDDSAAYVFCSAKTLDFFMQQARNAGFTIKNVLIWRKNNHTAGDLEAQYGQCYEPILYLNKGRRTINGKRLEDVWDFDRVPSDKLVHQNEKPIPLLMQCILKSSDEGDLVFDGFMGSASTALACMRTNRNFLGFELDGEYFKVAQKRIKEEMFNQKDMLEIDKIYQVDCLDGMSKIDDKSVSLILTDPPYEISRDSNYAKSAPIGKDTDRFRISIDFGDWDKQEAFDIGSMIKESYRCLKDGGYIVCFYDLWKIGVVKDAMIKVGFKQIRFIEWIKTNPVPINSKTNYLTNAREVAVCGVKGKNPIFNSEYDNGVYSFPICCDKGRFHPTQKPVSLFRSIINKHSCKGDIVLDCCIGSGTTAIACIQENRNFIGFETNREFYDKANKRIENELMIKQDSLF